VTQITKHHASFILLRNAGSREQNSGDDDKDHKDMHNGCRRLELSMNERPLKKRKPVRRR
jgi:hypothetical protein